MLNAHICVDEGRENQRRMSQSRFKSSLIWDRNEAVTFLKKRDIANIVIGCQSLGLSAF